MSDGEKMKAEIDLREIDLQLNNGLITTPAQVRLDWNEIDIGVYTPTASDGMDTHQITVVLADSKLQLIIRSPLGTTPEVRTLFDFSQVAPEPTEPPKPPRVPRPEPQTYSVGRIP